MALPSERVFYTEPQQRWMGSPLDHGMSPFGTNQTSRSRLDMSVYGSEAVKVTLRSKRRE